MNGVPAFIDHSEKLACESIATAMIFSNSPEELLKYFLTGLGERLAVSRVAIYQLTNQHEGIILLEAISPHIQNIKNQIYPISYFGVDALQNYPRDRVVKLSDTVQISETFTAHQCWQNTEVKAIMSAPIVFNSSTAFDQIWGLAFVQQCDRARQWQPQEAHFLFELSKVLSQCLQDWELRLQTSTPLKTAIPDAQIYNEENDHEEFIAKRVDLSRELEAVKSHLEPITDDIALLSTFVLSDDEENEILDRSRPKNNEASINNAINLAMQRLEQKPNYSSSPYPRVFEEIDPLQNAYGIDLESITLEDVLENCAQDENKAENKAENKDQSKVIYLQQKVGDLIESMEQKLDEIALLQLQVDELTASQQEFRQILLDLQSENSTPKIKDAVIKMYRSLL